MTGFAHPLDRERRQQEEQQTADLAQYIAPGVRPDDLQRMADMGLDAESLRKMLFALQGVPGPEMPVGGD